MGKVCNAKQGSCMHMLPTELEEQLVILSLKRYLYKLKNVSSHISCVTECGGVGPKRRRGSQVGHQRVYS